MRLLKFLTSIYVCKNKGRPLPLFVNGAKDVHHERSEKAQEMVNLNHSLQM